MSRFAIGESLGVLLYNVENHGMGLKARLSEVFRGEGFEVQEASEFTNVSGLIACGEVRVILTSYSTEGEGELQAILEYQNFEGVLVVIVDEEVLDEDEELERRLLELGVAAVFQVPFDPQLLFATVSRRLGEG